MVPSLIGQREYGLIAINKGDLLVQILLWAPVTLEIRTFSSSRYRKGTSGNEAFMTCFRRRSVEFYGLL
jgi:hypothetical protein